MNARSTKRIVTSALAVAALVFATGATARAADVAAELSSRETTVGFPVTLYVTVKNVSQPSEPAAPKLPDVEVRSLGAPSRSSQTTIINGRLSQSSSITYAWELTPRKPGQHEVPAQTLDVDGHRFTTPALSFEAHAIEPSDHVIAEIMGDRPSVYVGEPLKVTLRLWIEVYHNAPYDVTLSPEDTWNLVLADRSQWGPFQESLARLTSQRELPPFRQVRRADRDGVERSYYLYELQSTVQPQAAGTVPGGNVQVVVAYPTGLERAGGLLSFGRLAISSNQIVVADAQLASTEIKPLPTTGRPADFRGAVGQFEIATEASTHELKAGDPITLRITVSGGPRLDLLPAPPLAELSQLTENFKVADEPLAGVVRDNVKHFITTVRPRKAGVTEIPAISLSYFDPSTGTFHTVTSEPIAIDVQPADELALDSIVGGHPSSRATDDSSPADRDAARPVLNFANYTGPSVLAWDPPAQPWPWLAALLLPPVAFAGTVVWQRWNDGWTVSPRRRAKLAAQHALARLDRQATPDGVAAALLSYVADRCTVPVGGLTRREAVFLLDERMPHVAAVHEFDRVLSECESARFAGAPVEDTNRLVAEARQCLSHLEQECASGKDR
ncbi:MAG: BatD family protein [Pirellulales bacterium]|nr:BatD family protein [Pirellulales bacterium]